MSATVLIVDDDPEIRYILRMLLEHAGHHVLEADGGESALEIVGRERPQLITLDLSLPGRSGLEIAADLRQVESLKGVPIVALTAHAVGSGEGRLTEDFDGFLPKPIDPDCFVAELETFLEGARPKRP